MASSPLRLLLTIALLGAGCGGAGSAGVIDDGRPVIITTVAPITNITQNIVCDSAQVIGIVPEGVNSHTFEPRPSDAAAMSDADIVITNGLNLELPTLRLAENNVDAAARIIQLGDSAIDANDWIFDFSFPEADGDPNPHLWTNPAYGVRFAEIIRDEVIALHPSMSEQFTANAAVLIDRLAQLEEALHAATETVPSGARRLLTYHDSFPYFARDFGWEIIGAIQPSDFSEPSPSEVAALIDQIRAEQVSAIFGSEVFPSPVLEQIAEEAGATYIEDLRDDDLPGDPGSPEHSYIGLLVFDYVTIIDALGGDSSPLGVIETANLCDGAVYADE